MINNRSIAQQIIAEDIRVQKLLGEADLLGGIYTMGFERCLVLTNDLWKHRAGGIPKHCFLLATAMEPGQAPDDAEDEEVILLRVVGPASLPAEAELVSVRAEAMRELVTASGIDASTTPSAILDVLTRNEIQFSALEAKILGTFYDGDVDGRPLLLFGSDIETFHSASRYRVYKPYGLSLSIIASYPQMTTAEARAQNGDGEKVARVRLGTVRYSSSTRKRERDQERSTAVPVTVNIDDFVAMKTAIFGMTRMGKSNTMKTLATAVFQYSQETGTRIGQLLFDPAGEYANVNVQDQTALAQIGADHVTVFRFGAQQEEHGYRSLATNFFDQESVDVTWSIITAGVSHNRSNYVLSFLAANVIGPETPQDDWSEWERARRRRAALYATLLKAGFRPPEGWSIKFAAKRDVVSRVNTVLEQRHQSAVDSDSRGQIRLTPANLRPWIEALLEARHAEGFPPEWIDTEMDAVLVIFAASKGSGYRLLEPLRIFHSPQTQGDYAEAVLQELIEGKVVIVDLSLGGETVLKFISERIINHIVSDAARRFANGQEPHNLQIYLEEAHTLFNRDRFVKPSESDPYVRLAKEAAKFKIGLVYATQEVTSVDSVILSNTSNWIVTHLNNTIEVKELSKYYDFADYAALTLKAEDVGFARLKTRSGRYIVPIQIDLFDAQCINAARAATADGADKATSAQESS